MPLHTASQWVMCSPTDCLSVHLSVCLSLCLWHPSAFVCRRSPFRIGPFVSHCQWPLACFLARPGLHKKPYMFLAPNKIKKKQKLFTFLLSSVSMRINVSATATIAITYIYFFVYTNTLYSYDIFFLCARKCAAPPASSFRFPSVVAHEKQIKVDLPLLTSCWSPLYISFAPFWWSSFLYFWPSYCCAVTNAHWGAIGRIKSTKLLLAMNYVLIGRVFGQVNPGMIMKRTISVMPLGLLQMIFIFH